MRAFSWTAAPDSIASGHSTIVLTLPAEGF